MEVSLRDYEAILIADPELNEEGLTQLKTHFSDMVLRHGGRVQDTSVLGRRRLSYRIGKYSEGNYLQIKLQMPPASVDALRRTAVNIEPVVRLMLVLNNSVKEGA